MSLNSIHSRSFISPDCQLICLIDILFNLRIVEPTAKPTVVPTQKPTDSSEKRLTNPPSAQPSASPTYFPIMEPSLTAKLSTFSPTKGTGQKTTTEIPFQTNSHTPSDLISSFPSFAPTLDPSNSLFPKITVFKSYHPSETSSQTTIRTDISLFDYRSPGQFPTMNSGVSTSHFTSFVNDCASYLLSSVFLEDGIISQMEFTHFLMHHCMEQGLCGDRTIITYEELDVSLQIEFILGVCSRVDQEEKVECINELKTMWKSGNLFGFNASVDDLDLLVKDMCYNSYHHVLLMGLTATPGE